MNNSDNQKSIFTAPNYIVNRDAPGPASSQSRPPLLSRRSSTPDIRAIVNQTGRNTEHSLFTSEIQTGRECQIGPPDPPEAVKEPLESPGIALRPSSVARSVSQPNVRSAGQPEPITKNNKKRSREATEFGLAYKRPRLLSRKPRFSLDPSTFPSGPPATDQKGHPPSPLFFSHTQGQRPPLPPRFTSFEAGAAMLSKARAEDVDGIRTVKLARGTPSSSGPVRAMSTPGSRVSSDRLSVPRVITPEGVDHKSGLQELAQVGIDEFLEQDERLTFIIDLRDSTNFNPGTLKIIFVNAALRSFPTLVDTISGVSGFSSPTITGSASFPEFKSWATSFVKNQQPMDVPLPSFLFAGVNWTASTLRKRLRIFNGLYSTAANLGAGSSIAPSNGTPSQRPLSADTRWSGDGMSLDAHIESNMSVTSEPSDYFGNVTIQTSAPTSFPAMEREDRSDAPSSDSSNPNLTTAFPHATYGVEGTGNNGTNSTAFDTGPSHRANYSYHHEAVLGANTAAPFDAFSPPKEVETGFFDWTRLPNTPALPRHVQFARGVDWGATSLGPIENWPSALRHMSNLIMASPHPAAMYWGEDLVAIYNEAYILLAGQKHPKLMGQSYKEAWAEIWTEVEDVFKSAFITGEATMKDDDCLFIKRAGFLEETYFSWSIIPLVGEDGSVVGLYNPAFEKTRRKIAERRMLTLREVGERTATAREVKSFWGQVLKGLEYNEYDTPFALLYSVLEDTDSDTTSTTSSSVFGVKQCILEGTLGVPEGHIAAPQHLDLKTSTEGFGPVFREALSTDRPVLLQTSDGTLEPSLIDGMDWRGFGDPSTAAVVCPIHPTTGDTVLGFLVMGINPRRPYDDDYNLFIQLLSRQLATSMASVALFEEEIRRGQRAARLAALDRIELSEQLRARTQEAVESEIKFTRMAEFAPVGMFIANAQGRITFCNDTWYEITRHPREENSTDTWMDSVKDEDRPKVEQLWRDVTENKVPISAEFRFKTLWESRNGTTGETWVLASAYPEKNNDGSLKRIFGALTNISQQKWAEDFQKKRMEEAVELKRQQENFIDITSHEMRNPLSAILQSADEIATSLNQWRASNNKTSQLSTQLVADNLDAAQTIFLCAQHQKRIVDDILTLSKLDSALLVVTPVTAQPITVAQRALKMFESEMETNDIKFQFQVDNSFHRLEIDYVKCDPSRTLQVLINLTTNAIKFTTMEDNRSISVSLGASLRRPSDDGAVPVFDNPPVTYVPSKRGSSDIAVGDEWGSEEIVYIHFAVKDTGRGLSDDEKKLLFLRFSQASPRTHVQYGGSGLGLFISRELVELQGGEIGVASESGKGSTFAFYIQCRRSHPPSTPESMRMLPRKGSSAKTRSFESSPSALGDHSQLKVLIVEDNLVNQKVLSKQLRNLGCEVHLANHGIEALDKLKESKFWQGREQDGVDLSVILMDQEMPLMDGVTCAKKIREYQREGQVVRHVPIIAVTANARTEQIESAIKAGMDDVVSKPFRIQDLVPKMSELVERYTE